MVREIKFLILAGLWLLSACKPQPGTNFEQAAAERIMTAAAATVQAGDLPAQEAWTETPVPTQTASPPTAIPAEASTAVVKSETLNLRSGPGLLFKIIQNYPRGTRVILLEMTPDGHWIKVSTNDQEGWMSASYLDLTTLKETLPIVDWPAATMITGIVTDKKDNPVSGARIAATADGQRVEAVSTRDGNFYFYIPVEIPGPFNLEIVALNCGSSIAKIQADGSCAAVDYFPVHWQQSVYLPQTQPVHFLYEQGIAFLEGIVAYQDGNGASQILVRATRLTDKVQSEFVTPVGGEFRLPLGEGEWEVVAVRFEQDGTALISETRTYQITIPGQSLEYLTIPYGEILDRN